MGAGTGAVDVVMTSVSTGEIAAVSGDLTVIDTPVGGLSGAINLLDATLGAPLESDPDLRQSREDELATAGSATHDAIGAQIRQVVGITAVMVFSNDTDITDGNGLAPHSILLLVQGGADADVAAALLASIGDGIGMNPSFSGMTLVNVNDSEGVAQQMAFKRPTAVPIYARVTVTYDATKYPSDGDTEVKSAIATWGTAQAAGKDAVPRGANAQTFTVAGVDDADTLLYTDAIGAPVAWAATTGYVATPSSRSVVTNDGGRAYICTTSGTSGSTGPTGTGADIVDGAVHWAFLGNAIGKTDLFSLATWDTSRITVSSSAATP